MCSSRGSRASRPAPARLRLHPAQVRSRRPTSASHRARTASLPPPLSPPPPAGKLQSPFLSQRGTPQPPPAAVASVTPGSPPSPPPSPLQVYSHPAVVTPTPPESTSSPVPAGGQNKPFLNAPVGISYCSAFLVRVFTVADIYTEGEEWSDEFDDDAEEATPGVFLKTLI